jgi:hypothetical protein
VQKYNLIHPIFNTSLNKSYDNSMLVWLALLSLHPITKYRSVAAK